MLSPSQSEQYAAFMRRLIAEHGWAVQGVLPTRTEPPFSYTVGLTETGLPELILVGQPADITVGILNRLATQSLADDLKPGRRYDLVSGDETLTCLIGRVSAANRREYLRVAAYLYDRRRIKALQVFWPSKDGLFPVDEEWDPAIIQPVLA